MSHVAPMNESCRTYKWVMSHVWMSHVTHTNESCHMCTCAALHISIDLCMRERVCVCVCEWMWQKTSQVKKMYFRVRERHILPRNVTNVMRHIFCHRKKWQMWRHSPKSETGGWEEIRVRPALKQSLPQRYVCVGCQQWPSTQMTLFQVEGTRQSAWLDAVTVPLTRCEWMFVY